MDGDPSLSWRLSCRAPEVCQIHVLRLNKRLIVPLAQGIAVINCRLASVIAEGDCVWPRAAVLEVDCVVGEDVPVDQGARCVARIVDEGLGGVQGIVDGVEVGSGTGNDGAGDEAEVDSHEDVKEAERDQSQHGSELLVELHLSKWKAV